MAGAAGQGIAHTLMCGSDTSLGRLVYVYDDDTVELGPKVTCEGCTYGHALVGLSNGTALFADGQGKDLVVVHPTEGVVGRSKGANDGYAWTAVELPGLHFAVTQCAGFVIHRATGGCERVVKVGGLQGNVNALAVLPDGRLAVGHAGGVTLYTLDYGAASCEEVGHITSLDLVFDLIWVPGLPHSLISMEWGSGPYRLDLATLTQEEEAMQPAAGGDSHFLAPVPDLHPTAFVAVGDGGFGGVNYQSSTQGEVVIPWEGGLSCDAATVLPGGRVITALYGGGLRLVDLRQLEEDLIELEEDAGTVHETDATGAIGQVSRQGLVLLGRQGTPPGLRAACRAWEWGPRRAVVLSRRSHRTKKSV